MPSMLTLIATLVTVAAAQSADPGHCFPHSPGSGPVPTPDNSAAFLGFKNFSTAATSASTPQGYFTTSKDQSYTYNDASLFASYKELQTYDTQACADLCNSTTECSFFQVYFERNPLLAPGEACPNPASTTRIKCNVYTGTITDADAKNDGHYQTDFHVVIAGSNAYVKDVASSGQPFTAPGFEVDTYTSGGAIQAPLDCNGKDTFVGSKMWYDGKIEIQRCIDACTANNGCHFINTFMEQHNDVPSIQNCALYSARWPETYATNIGQYRGNQKITITNSYGLTVSDGTHEACVPKN